MTTDNDGSVRVREERYQLGDHFDDMSPETELVYTVIGAVLAVMILLLAFSYPFLF